ncbi:MAG: YggT family protein [Rhabdochlamydiaceae bacterium]|nr:YggT family protein [Candidatus Amphrikana amoebophyrae]
MFLYRLVQIVFSTYMLLLLIRIIASWFPNINRYRAMHFLQFYTDPYLNFFRRFIPPIGGTIDLSPIVAFIALSFLEKFVLYLVSFIL